MPPPPLALTRAGDIPVREFEDPALYAPWAAAAPLHVAAHPTPFTRCRMSATLLAADTSCMAPISAALRQAYTMSAASAFLHQYAQYGLQPGDFDECFACVEELLGAYAAL